MDPSLLHPPLAESQDTRSAWKIQFVELSVFLLLVVPSLVLSLFVVRRGGLGFVTTAVAIIFRDLSLVALIAYFLWRNGESVRRIGWTLRHGWAEAGLGVVLFVPFFFAAAWLDKLLLDAGLAPAATPKPSFLLENGPLEALLACAMVMVVALAEETIFRGYLMLRLTCVTRSTTAAVLLSSFIFALGHGYEGTAGLVTVGVMGLVFALVYLWRQSLVAPMVMHFLQDFIGVVLVPLLLGGR